MHVIFKVHLFLLFSYDLMFFVFSFFFTSFFTPVFHSFQSDTQLGVPTVYAVLVMLPFGYY